MVEGQLLRLLKGSNTNADLTKLNQTLTIQISEKML